MKNLTNKQDIIWGYLNIIVSMGANIILLPAIIVFLSDIELGLWYVFTSFGAFGNLFDFSFSPSFARNVAYAWNGAETLQKKEAAIIHDKDTNWHLLAVIISTCRILYGAIAVVVLLILAGFGSLYINSIMDGISGKHFLSWMIYMAAIFFNLYFGYYVPLLRGVGAVKIANQIQVISRLMQILVTLAFLLAGFGIIGGCLGYLFYGITYRLLSKRRFLRYCEIGENINKDNVSVSLNDIKRVIITVWYNTWREAIVSISTFIIGQTITIFCSLYLSLAETGVYSLGAQVTSTISQMARAHSITCLPEMQAAYINNKKERIREILSGSVVSFIIVYWVGMILVVSIGVPILYLIKPDILITRTLFVWFFVCQFVNIFPYCYTAYYSATNRIIYYKAYFVAAILCVALSFLFLDVLKMGVMGLISSQLLSQLVYNFWIWIYKANKELDLSVLPTMKKGVREINRLISSRGGRVAS